jgi:pyruvate/2-oxoglutarate dehydrogenase complex dihydrolipoamide acyltransferase (E2) component
MENSAAWTPIRLPELKTGEEPVRVSTWLVDVGETIEPGERLVDVLIPGVSFSVSSPAGGRLVKIERTTDCHVQPGDILAWLEPVPATD